MIRHNRVRVGSVCAVVTQHRLDKCASHGEAYTMVRSAASRSFRHARIQKNEPFSCAQGCGDYGVYCTCFLRDSKNQSRRVI